MRRKIVAVWMSLVMILSFIVILDVIIDFTSIARGTTLYVNTTGSAGAYTRIQEAINAAQPGDTVFVYDGTYNENIRIEKTLNLIGENKDTTIIDGINSDIVKIKADWVYITGFTITDSGNAWSNAGLKLSFVQNCTVVNNHFFGNVNGISIESSSSNHVINNTFSANNRAGIAIRFSSKISVINNNFNNDGILLEGSEISDFNSHDIPSNNIVNNYPILYYKDDNNINIDGIFGGQLFFVNCTNIELKNINLIDTVVGLQIAYSTDILLTNSSFSNNWYGIELCRSSKINILNNNISNNLRGIHLIRSSNNNNISRNILSSNIEHGIGLYVSSNNLIKENNVRKNWEGIYLSSSSNGNIITYNNCSFNSGNGVYVYGSSHNNILNNNIWNNTNGTHLLSSSNNNISDNYIFSNDAVGIYIQYRGDNIITRNNVTFNNIIGFKIYSSDENNVNNNIIFNNTQYGILIWESLGNNLIGNNIKFNDGTGINLGHSENSRIIDNNISSNQNGIYLSYSHNSNIIDNIVADNNINGIYLSSTLNNKITGNNVINNKYGMHLWQSSNNRIYYNNLINNIDQAFDDKNDNLWDNNYPNGGNYWSNYSGVDLNSTATQDVPPSDGIGDTPYVIDADSQDNYPLMEPYLLSVPSAPQNLKIEVGDGYLNLSWGPPLDNGGSPITGYNIYRNDTLTVYVSIGEDQLWFYDDNIISNITYAYYVSAVNDAGEGPLSTKVNAKAGRLPSEPTNVVVVAGDSYVNLKWNAPNYEGGFPITNYIIYRSTSSGNETFLFEVGDVSYYNDTSVTNEITYYYILSAKNAVGVGPFSNEVNATPKTLPPPPVQPPKKVKELPLWLWVITAVVIAVIVIGFIVGYMVLSKTRKQRPIQPSEIEEKVTFKEIVEDKAESTKPPPPPPPLL